MCVIPFGVIPPHPGVDILPAFFIAFHTPSAPVQKSVGKIKWLRYKCPNLQTKLDIWPGAIGFKLRTYPVELMDLWIELSRLWYKCPTIPKYKGITGPTNPNTKAYKFAITFFSPRSTSQ